MKAYAFDMKDWMESNKDLMDSYRAYDLTPQHWCSQMVTLALYFNKVADYIFTLSENLDSIILTIADEFDVEPSYLEQSPLKEYMERIVKSLMEFFKPINELEHTPVRVLYDRGILILVYE